MSMQLKNITITEQMVHWVRTQVESGQYGNDSENIRDLIRRDRNQQKAEIQLCTILDEAKASCISELIPQKIWEEIKARISTKNG